MADLTERLSDLSREHVDASLFTDLYGVSSELHVAALEALRIWAMRYRQNLASPIDEHGRISRWVWEAFLQSHRLVAPKQTAGNLGMTLQSFTNITERLRALKMLSPTFDVYPFATPKDAIQRFHETFPDLRFTVFADHSEYCEAIHGELNKLEIEVQAARDRTAQALGLDPPDFGYDWDVLTGDPVSLRFQVWLEFPANKKPIYLRPDVCGLYTYAMNKDILAAFVHPNAKPDEELVDQLVATNA